MNREIDHNSSVPLHAQVEQVLRAMIREPRYQDGECLPDELSLARQFSVSRSTVREAIKRLVFEGLVERRRGIGTRATPILAKAAVVAWPSFTREIRARGARVQEFHCRSELVEVTEQGARALQIDPGTRVRLIEGTWGADDEPVVWGRSWFHPRLGDLAGLDLSAPRYEALASATQVTAARSDEKVSATLADQEMAGRLRIEPGAVLLVRERVVRDAGSQPIEYAVNHYRADRFSYNISIDRKGE